MIQMRLREVMSCPQHRQTIVLLEDMTLCRTLAIAVDVDESHRLLREVARPVDGAHPIYDFVESVLRLCEATVTRVVLTRAPDAGLGATISLRRPEGETEAPCYLADALALARRAEIPVYVSVDVFSGAEASPLAAPAPPAPPARDDSGADVARWLDRITPADFSAG